MQLPALAVLTELVIFAAKQRGQNESLI